MRLRTEKLCDGVWALDDPFDNSLYLIEGEERALVIDTGLHGELLLPELKRLTNKPLILALTHLHVDHMYHAGEFLDVYASRDDLNAWKTLFMVYVFGHRLYRRKWHECDPKRYHPLDADSTIDLGGVTVRVLPAPGHTPGSVIYIDDVHRMLFTGDAFGSGRDVWMYLPGCSKLSAYQRQLHELNEQLQPLQAYRFCGGHRLHGMPYCKSPHSRPLNASVPRDMEKLCRAILNRQIKGKRVHIVPLLPLKVYALGSASIVIPFWKKR